MIWGVDVDLLGAPLGNAAHCSSFFDARLQKVFPTLDAVAKLPDPQVGLRLLRHCLSFGKVVFACRTTPCDFQTQQLQRYDAHVRTTFCDLTGLNPADDKWLLATRGFELSGLGLRRAWRHAPAAYLSSRTSCNKLCSKLDPDYLWEGEQPGTSPARALHALNSQLPAAKQVPLPSSEEAPLRQKEMPHLLDEAEREVLSGH